MKNEKLAGFQNDDIVDNSLIEAYDNSIDQLDYFIPTDHETVDKF